MGFKSIYSDESRQEFNAQPQSEFKGGAFGVPTAEDEALVSLFDSPSTIIKADTQYQGDPRVTSTKFPRDVGATPMPIMPQSKRKAVDITVPFNRVKPQY